MRALNLGGSSEGGGEDGDAKNPIVRHGSTGGGVRTGKAVAVGRGSLNGSILTARMGTCEPCTGNVPISFGGSSGSLSGLAIWFEVSASTRPSISECPDRGFERKDSLEDKADERSDTDELPGDPPSEPCPTC